MNKVILSGNLCRDIELRSTSSGKAVVSNCVAVQRDYKDPDGNYTSDFINIVVWGAQAEYLEKYAKKGDRLELVGRWTNRTYQDGKGENRTVNECVVENIKVFRKAQEDNNASPEDVEFDIADEDLPF